MRNAWRVAVMLLCAGLWVGCGNGDDQKKDGKGKAPSADEAAASDTALAVVKAMETGDGEAITKLYDAPDDDKDFLRKLAPISSKMDAFANAGAKAYGRTVWSAAAKKVEMESVTKVAFPTVAEVKAKGGISCKVEGDKATCKIPTMGNPMKLVKKDGKWLALVDAKELPAKAEREQMLQVTGAMAKAAAAVQSKIGKPGITADRIFAEFMAEFRKAAGAPPTPPTPPTP